jgi:hypothetical protein
MYLAASPGDVRLAIHPIEGAHPDDMCWRVYLATLPLLDLYERYRDDVKPFFLTGGFCGVRLFIYPIVPAALWRLYVAPRLAGTQKDRARPTAVIGVQAPFYGAALHTEFGFDPPTLEDEL